MPQFSSKLRQVARAYYYALSVQLWKFYLITIQSSFKYQYPNRSSPKQVQHRAERKKRTIGYRTLQARLSVPQMIRVTPTIEPIKR